MAVDLTATTEERIVSYSTNMHQIGIRNTNLFLLGLTLVFALQACIPTPTITQQATVANTNAPVARPKGVHVIPIKVGVYYGSDLRNFVHQDFTTGRNTLEIPVGEASENHFDKVFAALFSQTIELDDRPPYGKAKYGGDTSNLAAVMEVRIEDFSYDWRPMSAGPFTAEVTYRFILYSPSGNTVSSWTLTGVDTAKIGFGENGLTFTGERADKAMRAASTKFMAGFRNRPEITRWLALTSAPQSGTAMSSGSGDPEKRQDRLKDVTVEASLYSQDGAEMTPYYSGNTSQILTAVINITNTGSQSIVIRPSDITLSPRSGVRLDPVSVRRVVDRVYTLEGTDASEAVGVLINPALGALLTLGEGSEKDSEKERLADFFRSKQLKDSTLGPNQSVSGHVYFEALGIDGKFQEAELRVRVGETSSTQNFDATVMVGRGTATTNDLVAASFGAATVASAKKLATQRKPSAIKQEVSPAPAAAGPQRISSAQELLDLLSNSTGSGTSERGTQFATYSRQDGHMVARTLKGSVDEGVWEITSDGRYCRQWNNWRDGARDCFYVSRMKDGRFRFKGINKSYDSTVSITPGDPRGLRRRMSTTEGAPLHIAGIATLSVATDVTTRSAGDYKTEAVYLPEDPQSRGLRIAILPFADKFPLRNSQAGNDLLRFSGELLNTQSGLTLAYSYYQSELGGGPKLDPGAIWKGNLEKIPNKPAIYAIANEIDADSALTFFHAPRTADSYASDLYMVDVYVFDLTYGRMYNDRADERDYKKVTKKLFDDLITDRERAGLRQVSGKTIATAMTSLQPEVAGERLTAHQVKTVFLGNTETGTYINRGRKVEYSEFYRKDGRIKGVDAMHGKYDAFYDIRKDGCFYLDYPGDLHDGCYYFEHVEGNHYRSMYPDGSSSIVTILKGDPENLNQ
jgi:hypothetical protein